MKKSFGGGHLETHSTWVVVKLWTLSLFSYNWRLCRTSHLSSILIPFDIEKKILEKNLSMDWFIEKKINLYNLFQTAKRLVKRKHSRGLEDIQAVLQMSSVTYWGFEVEEIAGIPCWDRWSQDFERRPINWLTYRVECKTRGTKVSSLFFSPQPNPHAHTWNTT